MILLLPFAFLAGIVTILSPCILPVLPIVLSGTVAGTRRPFGIILGFVASFTFFTLSLSTLVKLTGISADALRQGATLIIAVFGLSLIFNNIQVLFKTLLAKLSNVAPKVGGQGFFGGIPIGACLGLVWAPCVGPILASIITLAATGTITSSTVLITLAYATGTAIPMLAITYGGRQLFTRVSWLLPHTPTIQKLFGILMLLTALAIYFNIDRKFQAYIVEKFPGYGVGLTSLEDTTTVRQELKRLEKQSQVPTGTWQNRESTQSAAPSAMLSNTFMAPDFTGGTQWFNSDPLTIIELKGKVLVVDFWTYTCINCIRTLPYLKEWYKKYKDKGLVIVGVHTPEFEFEKDPKNVAQAIKDFEIEYPVVQDNEYLIWKAYDNHYWPAKYFVDKEGRVRNSHFGEGAYQESEKLIQELLAETGSIAKVPLVDIKEQTSSARTPETYLGYRRMANFASQERVRQDRIATYTIPKVLPVRTFAYGGKWLIASEHALAKEDARLSFHFEAKEVYLVMRSREGMRKVTVFLDGTIVESKHAGEDVQNGAVTVQKDGMYRLIKLPKTGSHSLILELEEGIEVYAFTFG